VSKQLRTRDPGVSKSYEDGCVRKLAVASLTVFAGHELASSFTQGGSLQPRPFTFTVRYSVVRPQVAHLEVFEPRVTNEGFTPPRDVVPLVLRP
jgi:hypothetical protein